MASLLMSCSLATLSVYLRQMGYTLLYVDLADAVYVRAEYIHHFGNIPRDDATIYQLGWTGHPGYRTFAAMYRIGGIDVPWFDGAVAFEDRRDALLQRILHHAKVAVSFTESAYDESYPLMFTFCEHASDGPCATHSVYLPSNMPKPRVVTIPEFSVLASG
jgi:hypothetical protein